MPDDISQYLPLEGKTWGDHAIDTLNQQMSDLASETRDAVAQAKAAGSTALNKLEEKFPALAQAEDAAANAWKSTFGGTDITAQIAVHELRDNRAAIETLKGKYATRDDRFNEMSTEEFLNNVLAKNNPGSLPDADKLIRTLNVEEDAFEKRQMEFKKAAVVGINNDSWLGYYTDTAPLHSGDAQKKIDDEAKAKANENPYAHPWWERLGSGISSAIDKANAGLASVDDWANHGTGSWNYSDASLAKLNRQETAELGNKFADLYRAEIDLAKKEITAVKGPVTDERGAEVLENEARGVVLTAVQQVNATGKASPGRDFHFQVYEKVKQIGDSLAKGQLAHDVPQVYDDPKNAEALLRAVVASGHDEFKGISVADFATSPHKKDIIAAFKTDFADELATAKAATKGDENAAMVKVLGAAEVVYHDPNGGNNGKNDMSERRYHAAVSAELAREISPNQAVSPAPETHPAPGQVSASTGTKQEEKKAPDGGAAVGAAVGAGLAANQNKTEKPPEKKPEEQAVPQVAAVQPGEQITDSHKVGRAEVELAEGEKYKANLEYMRKIGRVDEVAATRVAADLKDFAKDWNADHKEQQVNTSGVLDDKMLAALDARHLELNKGKDIDLKTLAAKLLHNNHSEAGQEQPTRLAAKPREQGQGAQGQGTQGKVYSLEELAQSAAQMDKIVTQHVADQNQQEKDTGIKPSQALLNAELTVVKTEHAVLDIISDEAAKGHTTITADDLKARLAAAGVSPAADHDGATPAQRRPASAQQDQAFGRGSQTI